MYFHKILRVLQMICILGEDENERVTKIESRDAIFLEEDFPKRCEINGDFQLYGMEDFEASGNVRHIDSTPTE